MPTYDPMLDSPEAAAFNEALEADRRFSDEHIMPILEQAAREGQELVTIPDDIRLEWARLSDNVRQAFAAYKRVTGE